MDDQREEKVSSQLQSPTRNLADWLTGFLELTKRSEPPEIFRKWVGLSTLASALERKCSFHNGFLKFFPNMYVVLIGSPASRKGVAMGQGFFFLEELGRKTGNPLTIAPDATSRQAVIRKLKNSKKKFLNIKTGESFTHCSMTIHSDEFTVFTGYNDIDFLTVLGNWFDCGKGQRGKWTYETISRNEEEIEGIWVNWLGGTTPTLLHSALPTESIGTGFMSRLMPVKFNGEVERKAMQEFNSHEVHLMAVLAEDLERIHKLSGEFQMHEEFKKKFDYWYENECIEETSLDKKKFAAYLSRRTMHVVKLMMILSASRSDEMILEEVDFERARKLLEELEAGMQKTYDSLGKFEFNNLMNEIVEFLQTTGEITESKFVKKFKHDAEKNVLLKILETLRLTKEVKLLPGKRGDSLIKWVGES